ncbi:MAG: ATP-binding protein [Acidobacteriota bacterium]|nr:ATP-binding protein [Acidobacteriota bacterium]
MASLVLLAVGWWRTRRRLRAVLAAREAELALAGAETAAAAEEQAQLLSRFAHELRTPVHSARAMVDLLTSAANDPDQAPPLDTLRYSLEMLHGLVDGALELARGGDRGIVLRPEATRLGGLVEEVLGILRPVAESKPLELRAQVGGGVPVWAEVDPLRLRQVLINLGTNAVRYTREGFVELGIEKRADRLHFEVRDSGVGIAADDLERLFQPFERADTTLARSVEGVGLGLAVSRRLVAAMGGELGCESRRGEGSVFHFSLPCHRVTEPPVDPAGLEAGSAPVGAAALRVRVVDDDPGHRLAARAWLAGAGWSVEAVADAEAGLEDLEEVDVLLVDLHLPGIDGFELARRVAASGLEPPPVLVAMSAELSRPVWQRCAEAGFSDQLAKPFDRRALLRLLALHSKDREASLVGWEPESGETPAALRETPALAALWRLEQRTGEAQLAPAQDGFAVAVQRLTVAAESAKGPGARDEELIEAAHGLVGTAGILGCHHLEELSRQLVQSLRRGEAVSGEEDRAQSVMAAAAAALDDLTARIERACQEGAGRAGDEGRRASREGPNRLKGSQH